MKNFLLIVTFTMLFFQLQAKKVPGIIVSKGSSRDVTFDIRVPLLGDEPNFLRIQYRVKYYDENGKKHILRPEDADEIMFEYGGIPVHMISCENTIEVTNLFSTSSRIFLKLEIDGPLRLYRHYAQRTSASPSGGVSSSYIVENFIFQKGRGRLKQPRFLSWKKDMLEYFNDCPELRDQIESKELKRREIEAIVLFYNKNCGKR